MAAMSDFLENRLIDGIFRGGAASSTNTLNSAAVVKGIWTATTSYVVGDIVFPHASMTGAGGKFLRCIVAQNSGSTNTLAIGNPGSTVTDNAQAMWEVLSGVPSLNNLYVALLTAAPSDTGGGTEVSGNNYARAQVACTKVAWAGTVAATSTADSTGTSGTTSNNAAVTFPAPTGGNWGVCSHFGIYDNLTTGNLLFWGALTASKTVNNGDAAPSFAISALSIQIDN